ncbi:MAG: hypothetical protein ACJAQT_005260 [Akkermansiaceae bacterium]|jgi:hypothetical protein
MRGFPPMTIIPREKKKTIPNKQASVPIVRIIVLIVERVQKSRMRVKLMA